MPCEKLPSGKTVSKSRPKHRTDPNIVYHFKKFYLKKEQITIFVIPIDFQHILVTSSGSGREVSCMVYFVSQ